MWDDEIFVLIDVTRTKENVVVDLQAPVPQFLRQAQDLFGIDDVPGFDGHRLTLEDQLGCDHAASSESALFHYDLGRSPDLNRNHRLNA